MNNKTKTDRLHDLLPKHLNTQTNANWKALLDAIGEQDQLTSDLISQVKQQFFVNTSSRPYIDVLAANNNISRPKLVGMDDTSFRQYIPVLSYKPKQVKLIIDQLLDIFFFKQATTAYLTSKAFAPFTLQDGWELSYSVDEANNEYVLFKAADFTDITKATADEVVAAINRQAKYSYANNYYDSVSKNNFIQLFTNTIGSKGSLRILGGRANIALQFNGFLSNAGNGSNTQWTVTKVGDKVTFTNSGGASAGIDQLQVGDIAVINLSNNVGSFAITHVDLTSSSIQFTNLFGTAGTYTQTDSTQVKFLRPQKYVAYTNNRRAMTWETSPGDIVVEMPTSPPVVKRSLKGSFHMNGAFANMVAMPSGTSLTLDDASKFPLSGSFWLETVNQIQSRLMTPSENTLISSNSNGRLQGQLQKYTYTSRATLTTTGNTAVSNPFQVTGLASVVGIAPGQSVLMPGVPAYATVNGIVGNTVNLSHPVTANGTNVTVTFAGNTLTGITPSLPTTAGLNEFSLSSLARTSGVVIATTSSPHNFAVGETVIISGSSGIVESTVTGNIANNSNTLTGLSSTNGVSSGMVAVSSNIPAGTTVLSVSGSTVTLSNPATGTQTGATIYFNENLNGSFKITGVTGSTFTYSCLGMNGTAVTAGSSRVERLGMATSGSKVYLTKSQPNTVTRITGSYIWDKAAPFVLSSNTTTSVDSIQAGKIVRLLNINANTIPSQGGYVVFDYGKSNQEGPVRYLYAPNSSTIAIDPSYTFLFDHPSGATVTSINHKGPHVMSGTGSEYAPYITNPSDARTILETLIESVKSAGIFVDFLVRYPEQLYAALDVYQSGITPGA